GSGGVDLLWNTLAGLGRRQRDAAAGTGQAEPQRATRLREKDEPSLGSRDLKGAVEHNRQHFVENLPGAESSQPGEQRVDVPEVDGARLGRRIGAEHLQLGLSESNAIAGLENRLVNLVVVDEGAETRAAVQNLPTSGDFDEPGVASRNLRVVQLQLVVRAAADGERTVFDDNRPLAGRLGKKELDHCATVHTCRLEACQQRKSSSRAPQSGPS